MPFFSIVIPTYNRAHLIGKTIESVLAQAFNDFEVLVIDDGGKDNTENVVKSFNSEVLKYYWKENAERGAARNFGVKMAKGKFISFLDSDDLLYPNHLLKAYELIQHNPEKSFFHLGYDIKDSNGNLKNKIDNLNENTGSSLIFGNKLSCNGVFLRREIAILNPFIENRKLAASEDWELWLRISLKHQLIVDNTITSTIINHNERSVLTFDIDKLIESKLYFVQLIFGNPEMSSVFGKFKRRFVSDAYSYIALHLALMKKSKRLILKYTILSIINYPMFLFKRRFLAILKHFF